MTSERPQLVRALLAESLAAWRVTGNVALDRDGALTISGATASVRIEASPPELPFRWLVTVDGRQRGAVSIAAVLRQVRGALDPGYAKARVRIAAPGAFLVSET